MMRVLLVALLGVVLYWVLGPDWPVIPAGRAVPAASDDGGYAARVESYYDISGPVPRRAWRCPASESLRSCAQALAFRGRTPVVLTGTPAASWAALRKWRDPAYLES